MTTWTLSGGILFVSFETILSPELVGVFYMAKQLTDKLLQLTHTAEAGHNLKMLCIVFVHIYLEEADMWLHNKYANVYIAL